MQRNKNRGLYAFFCCTVFLANILNAGCQQKTKPEKEDIVLSYEGKNPVLEFVKTITVEELREHVSYLASDTMEGRQSGSEGAEAAALYIGEFFGDKNLNGFFSGEDAYFQKFNMEKREIVECFLKNENIQVDNWTDFLEISNDYYGEKDVVMYFLRYGREQDFAGIDIKGKIVAFWSGDSESKQSTGDIDREKIAFAAEQGAAGSILVPQDEEKFLNYIQQIKPYFPSVRYYLFKNSEEALHSQRNISISSSALANLFGKSPKEFESLKKQRYSRKDTFPALSTKVRMKTSFKSHGVIPTKNVLGFIEGTDKKDEYIILSAHYDGRGIVDGKICNGANDNATGVSAVMEIAKAFSLAVEKGYQPRRSIIFFLPSAEELLGLGSTYYVDNPVVPLSKTIVDVNMDPLGREDAERPDLDNHLYIYTSKYGKTDLNEIRAKVEKDFTANLRIEEKESYQGSDHVFFERKGIPAIAFTTGSCKDNHGPGDDADKIQYQKLRDITKLIFATVWEIANREERIKN